MKEAGKSAIYKITNIINGKKYIGKTTIGLENRFQTHKYASKKVNTYLYKSMRKYGIENFIIELVENVSNLSILDDREIFWIEKLQPEYNLTAGGTGGNTIMMLSEKKKKEHAKKGSIASRKYWDNITPEEYKKRQKIAANIANVRDSSYLIEIGKINKELYSKKALIITPSGEQLIIESVSDFCKKNNLNYGNMKSVLRGNTAQKTCKRYTGKYL